MIERMRREDHKYISDSKYMRVRIKKRDQKYINASKLMRMRMKRGRTLPIMIIIDIFPFSKVSNRPSNLVENIRSLIYFISI